MRKEPVHRCARIRAYLHSLVTTLGATAQSEQDVVEAATARAVAAGRQFVVPDDVKSATLDVLRERFVIVPAEASVRGVPVEAFIADVVARTELP